MGRYTNIYCKQCKHSFTGGYSRLGFDSNLGLPFLQCPKCGQIYKTRKKPWSKMTKFDKTRLIINRAVQSMVNALIPMFVFVMIGHSVLNLSDEELFSSSSLTVLIFLSLLISGIFIFFNTKKYIKVTEEAFQKSDYTSFFR